ncbi:MAG: AI-2E family transporter [Chloroflexi bacterium]|nr:MAG: AI-2E family transporter [Chloroflexota bacterium]
MSNLQNSSSGWSSTNRLVVPLILIAIAVAIWIIRSILLLVFASIILVVFFTMPVRFLGRYGVRRTPAILLSLVGLVVLFIILARLILPSLIEQFSILITQEIPRGIDALIQWWNSGQIYDTFPFLRDVLGPVSGELRLSNEVVNTVVNQISSALGQVGTSVLPVLGGVANTVLSLLIIFFMSMYFLTDPKGYEEGIIKLFPLWYRHRVREIKDRIDFTLRGWLQVTFISMVITGVGTAIGLAIIGIEQWVALGVLAGLLSFIPNFGPIVALIPSIAVGILQAPENVGWIIVVIYGVSAVQSQLISPLLVNESLNIPPVLVLLGQIISGIFFGFIGIMLAVPITAVVKILVDEVYIKDILGDRGEELPKEIYIDEELTAPDGI